MSQEIPECHEENKGAREYFRTELHILTALNGSDKIIAAMKVTQSLFTNLVPFQPVDFQPLIDHLKRVNFRTESQSDYKINETADIFVSAYLLDKRLWHQILSEFEI